MIFLGLVHGAGAAGPSSRQTSESKPLLRFEESLDGMGTTTTVVVYGEDRFRLQAAVEAAFDEARRIEDLLSNYRPQSEWSQMNRSAGSAPFKASRELFELIDECVRVSQASEGAFDITVGPLMKVWGFYKGTGRFPHRAEIKGAMANVGYRYLTLDRSAQTIRYERAGMDLDPGGIGKGYAVDRMADILRANGIPLLAVRAEEK